MNQPKLNVPEVRAQIARLGDPYWRVAARVGCSPSSFSAFLRGRRLAPVDFAVRLAKALRVELAAITNPLTSPAR